MSVSVIRCAEPACVFWMSKPFTVSRWSNFCLLCCLQCSHSSATSWYVLYLFWSLYNKFSSILSVNLYLDWTSKHGKWTLSFCLYNSLPGTEMAQLVCGGCHTLLMYIRGATSVQCSCCHTVNLALEGV